MILEKTETEQEALAKTALPQVYTPQRGRVEDDSGIPLGKFLRSKIDPKSVGRATVTYKGKLYVFLGLDRSGDKILLRERLGGPLRQFKLDVVLTQTADGPEKVS
jgi:hypothetical protein